VQLKELAPEDLSPEQRLDALFKKLKQLPHSDAVLAIRRSTVQLEELTVLRAPFSELWFFWQADGAGAKWKLLGNVLSNPRLIEFFLSAVRGAANGQFRGGTYFGALLVTRARLRSSVSSGPRSERWA
jgi:hypothetical protein